MPDVGVIALVPEHWGGTWMSRHQILTRLSRYYQVVWFNPPRGRTKLNRKYAPDGVVDDAEMPASSFFTYTHGRLLPKINREGKLKEVTARLRLERAKAILRRHGCTRFVLYIWRPDYHEAIDLIEHDVSLYHVVDEYTFAFQEQPITPNEQRLLERSDCVIVHSPGLLDKKGHINPNTHYITNGVDYRTFAQSQAEPADMASIPRPRIGYSGRIKRQLDWSLLLDVVRANASYSFVFVGPMVTLTAKQQTEKDARDAVFAEPNVYYLGNKPKEAVPGYIQHMDVCSMCYLRNDYTKFIFPLKLHEYLAAGKPVVGTRIKSLEAFPEVVAVASTVDEWNTALSAALADSSRTSEKVQQRRAIARDNDWDTITFKVARVLGEKLGPDVVTRLENSHSGAIASTR